MAMKQWFRSLQPMPLYVVLSLTIVYFMVQLVVSHVTHALTLLVDSYHMLCNIIALAGCIVTIKHGQSEPKPSNGGSVSSSGEDLRTDQETTKGAETKKAIARAHSTKQERRLKNTFGWARIDVVMMLIVCVFMASLCFSLLVEAVQTLIHIDHQDAMHHPIPVLCIGGFGLVLNGLCYLLIGGYTFHQGSFLHLTDQGDVVLDRVMSGDSVTKGERRLSRSRSTRVVTQQAAQRQGVWEMSRDVVSTVFVVICSVIVYFTNTEVAKFVDPILSIISAIALLILSYPYMKESGLILLQTIPASMDIDSLRCCLLEAFPDIVNVHDFHVWQLTADKIVATAHIIFEDPTVYGRITEDILNFFHENGITEVTVQPEFHLVSGSPSAVTAVVAAVPRCLMQCPGDTCIDRHCCGDGSGESNTDLNSIVSGSPALRHRTASKKNSKASSASAVSLTSAKIFEPAQPELKQSYSESSIAAAIKPDRTEPESSNTQATIEKPPVTVRSQSVQVQTVVNSLPQVESAMPNEICDKNTNQESTPL